ncbi:DegT/DnrJ/EryC1/StrS family aminotransferase [Bradyrhizobium sp. CB82]|uniref:DegT/DnrJ/EryC1/StrS family aminotransferase n=1 Tax=Bradyrhizobium sp. CB82 TaxID=3039159 RepID=UPI0024B22B6C|nr:DegT/DnrJ/EryC1/StrS family aminotransferase [Bradyrhizobium sp. CB82]WFU40198.1 DegT/DnrJ/EryC1/StrS family aminotransferase [Bradyrhizobium sp. CB82]
MNAEFYRHPLSKADAAAVAAVLDTPFLTTGKVCASVERQIESYFGVPHAVLMNSWTNGAFAVLLAMELQPSDEVIIPAMTFIATANVIVLAGGTPVFVDVDPRTLLMTPESVEKAVTARTRAVMPVHLYGQMCDMRGIRHAVSRARSVGSEPIIIEDCAHCFEGARDGYKPGRYSDAAIFSFYATKNITCGEGGAAIFNSEKLYQRTLETRSHGMSATAIDRFREGRYNHWDMNRLGTKANLPDLLAALLPKQIAAIDQRLIERKRLAERYRSAFEAGPLRLVEQIGTGVSAEHLFVVGVGNGARDVAIARLNEARVGVTVNYRSVPETSFYRRRLGGLVNEWPVAKKWGDETLSLPLFPNLSQAEQDYVIATVRRVVYPLVDA